jgi:subtilisin family serine protease
LRAEPDVARHFFAIDPISGPLDAQFDNQQYYFDIGVVAMWVRGLTGISATHPITVAVIDTGVDLDHPDIDDNLVAGFDFVDMDGLPQDADPDSHGSMVAGVIGAEINNDVLGDTARGVAGIGGGDTQSATLGLRIMPLRVAVDVSLGFDCARSAQAIDYATSHGARVINMSYGGEDDCALELEAVQRAYDAGVALVAGAGNGNTSTPFYPAAYGAGTNDPMVIAVAGLYPSGLKADASNYGTWVDVGAPFRQIRSITKGGGYDSDSGTSFSAPFVSGLVGVLMSNCGWSRDRAVLTVLASPDSVDEVEGNEMFQGLLGAGRINADRASAMTHDVYLPFILHGL